MTDAELYEWAQARYGHQMCADCTPEMLRRFHADVLAMEARSSSGE